MHSQESFGIGLLRALKEATRLEKEFMGSQRYWFVVQQETPIGVGHYTGTQRLGRLSSRSILNVDEDLFCPLSKAIAIRAPL